jgi:hypothetical protein
MVEECGVLCDLGISLLWALSTNPVMLINKILTAQIMVRFETENKLNEKLAWRI